MADVQYDLIDAEYVDVKDQRVYPNQWTPNSRTVAYYPLDAANQYNDCSWHNYHLTKNTYASQWNYGPNVESCYFNSRGTSTWACWLYRSTDRIFNSTDWEKRYTILFWIWYDWWDMRYNPRIVGRYNGEIIVYNWSAFWCYDTYNWPTMSSWSWNLIWANLDFNTKKISWYKNWEYVSTQTYPDGLATQADWIVLWTRDSATTTSYWDKFSWYMWDVIVEQWLRDKDSHKRFYNQTRRKYHIFEEWDLIAFYPLTEDSNDKNSKNKFAPFNFTSSNVTFDENWANLDWSTNLITRPYSFMHGDFTYSVCFSFKTNTISNSRWEFFSFMRDVSGTRAPLLSLRNTTIQLDYNWVTWWTFTFTAAADTWYRAVFLHKSWTENELYINGVSVWTVNMSSAQNCWTNAMHIGQEMDNSSRFNWYIRNFKIVRWIMDSAAIAKDYEKYWS